MPVHPIELYATPALANERFYGAFNALDADAMRSVWRDGPDIACIHPGRPALYGDDVCGSWEAIFASASGMQVSRRDERVYDNGSMAIVTAIEEVANFLVSPTVAQLSVTNVYEYDADDDRWYCVLHHAAPCVLGNGDDDDD